MKENSINSMNGIKQITVDGKMQSIRLVFTQPVSFGNTDICLFDLSGRLIMTLFSGRLSATHVTLPLNQTKILQGIYMLRVMINNNIVMNKTIKIK